MINKRRGEEGNGQRGMINDRWQHLSSEKVCEQQENMCIHIFILFLSCLFVSRAMGHPPLPVTYWGLLPTLGSSSFVDITNSWLSSQACCVVSAGQ